MKRIFLTLTFAALATALFAQSYYVINKVLPDTLNSNSRNLIGMAEDVSKRVDRTFEAYKVGMEVNLDSIYNEGLVDAYIGQVKALELSLKNQFYINDTIPITKQGDEYFLPTDSVFSISYKKNEVFSRYKYLEGKYGVSAVKGLAEFAGLKSDWDIYTDYLNQLSAQ